MLIDNTRGNYRFLAGIAPYSSGVVSMAGYEIVHVTLRRPLALDHGFERIEHYLEDAGRPRHALCAMELRLPAPLSFGGFADFNRGYQQQLAAWDLLIEGRNPIARTNIAPALMPPDQPSLYGFAYTKPTNDPGIPTFIVAGAGDLHDQADLSAAAIVRPGEESAEAMREKATTVMQVMTARVQGLGLDWSDATTINIYTTHPLHPFLVDTVLAQIGEAAGHGIRWHFGDPPIRGLAYEMDLRGVRVEYTL